MPVLEWGGRPARITCTVAAESGLMGTYKDNGDRMRYGQRARHSLLASCLRRIDASRLRSLPLRVNGLGGPMRTARGSVVRRGTRKDSAGDSLWTGG